MDQTNSEIESQAQGQTLSQSLSLTLSQTLRWTRDGILQFNPTPFESFEKLVLAPQLKERLQQRVEVFKKGRDSFHSFQLPWRYGLFFYGPSGSGKTAASRSLAFLLDWPHLTIPAHEILDAHLLERAFNDAISHSHRVIVLEDVDRMVKCMEPVVFFELLDHAMQRAEGTLWVAVSRHPEEVPKTQLLRPGRFDESIRMEPPSAELRKDLIKNLIPIEGLEWDEATLLEWTEQTSGLTFSHFEELRQLAARMKIEGLSPNDLWPALRSYVEDQAIAGDRLGGLSDATEDIKVRVEQMDSRVLMAALDMTDVFRKLMEKVLGDAVEQAKDSKSGEQQN